MESICVSRTGCGASKEEYGNTDIFSIVCS